MFGVSGVGDERSESRARHVGRGGLRASSDLLLFPTHELVTFWEYLAANDVCGDMKTLEEIREKIEQASDRRAELYHALSEGHDPAAAAELHQLEKEINQLWEQQRSVRASIRFGDRDHILQRARTEERIERSAA